MPLKDVIEVRMYKALLQIAEDKSIAAQHRLKALKELREIDLVRRARRKAKREMKMKEQQKNLLG